MRTGHPQVCTISRHMQAQRARCLLEGFMTGIQCAQASDSAAREQLEKVVEVLDTERCTSFQDCVAWARHRFQVRCAAPEVRHTGSAPHVGRASQYCPGKLPNSQPCSPSTPFVPVSIPGHVQDAGSNSGYCMAAKGGCSAPAKGGCRSYYLILHACKGWLPRTCEGWLRHTCAMSPSAVLRQWMLEQPLCCLCNAVGTWHGAASAASCLPSSLT